MKTKITLIFSIFLCIFGVRVYSQETIHYDFTDQSIQFATRPNPIGGYYPPVNMNLVTKELSAQPFSDNAKVASVASSIYGPAGNKPNVFFGGDLPSTNMFGFSAVPLITKRTFHRDDFPILLEADFFSRENTGNYNEHYFWIGQDSLSNYSQLSSFPTITEQEGTVIGGLPFRTFVVDLGTSETDRISHNDIYHYKADNNEWYNQKAILDTIGGKLAIMNIKINDYCIFDAFAEGPIIIDDTSFLDQFRLAVNIDDLGSGFTIKTKIERPNFTVQIPTKICIGKCFDLDAVVSNFYCDAINVKWELPGSNNPIADGKLVKNVCYASAGQYEIKIYLNDILFDTKSIEVLDLSSSSISHSMCQGESFTLNGETYTAAGIYTQNLVNANGCDSTIVLELSLLTPSESVLEYTLCAGESILVNGVSYNAEGQYTQTLTNDAGCDSTIVINIDGGSTTLSYNFDACNALSTPNSMDYSEFQPINIKTLDCGEITSGYLYRNNVLENKHSCTSGNNNVAMCIGALDNCQYVAGSDRSLIIEFTAKSDPGSIISFNCLNFFEKAPPTFAWIAGASGPNNYPTKFGIRIIRDGVEIFNESNLPTSMTWNKEAFGFGGDEAFVIDGQASFRIEILPYCLVGNGASVAAWDMDDLALDISCSNKDNRMIGGKLISDLTNTNNIEVRNFKGNTYESQMTDENGSFIFKRNDPSKEIQLKAIKNDECNLGLTTLDLILIQQHIVGLKKFSHPLQYVAADVNDSKSINSSDLVQLRKVILGLQNGFKNNDCWKFIEATDLDNNKTPWEFSNTLYMPPSAENMLTANFIGVKIGDVSGVQLFQNTDLDLRSANSALIHFSKLNENTIGIITDNDLDILGLQMTINAPANSKNLSITGQILPLKEENFYLNDSKINISWNDNNGLSIPAGSILFTINTNVAIGDDLLPYFRLQESGVNEAYDKSDLNVISLLDTRRNIKSNEEGPILFTPNPFADKLTLKYNSTQKSKMLLTFYNSMGQIIYESPMDLEYGLNQINISSNKFENFYGLIHYKLANESMQYTGKILRLE